MFKYHSLNNNLVVAELIDESFVIKDSQDAIDLFTSSNDDFFNLGSGIAGDIAEIFELPCQAGYNW
jgi:hypothetical protein